MDGTGQAGRIGQVERLTRETEIRLRVNLDGAGRTEGRSGVPFLDHMLDQIARHGLLDLTIEARGDLEVDCHHLVEDVGIALGQALRQAVGDGAGLRRFGDALVPMDETLALAAIDISGRGFLAFDASFPGQRVGGLDTEMVEEFFRALATNAGITLHLKILSGKNTHHMVEGLFKAFARALSEAVSIDPRVQGIPSTKGML